MHTPRAECSAVGLRVDQRASHRDPLIRLVNGQQAQQRVGGSAASRGLRRGTLVDPGDQFVVPGVRDGQSQSVGLVDERPIVGHRRQLAGVPNCQCAETDRGGTESIVGERFTVAADRDRLEKIQLRLAPGRQVKAVPGTEMIPPRRIVTAGLPRVHNRDQPTGVARTTLEEERQTGAGLVEKLGVNFDTTPNQLGNGVTKHRRLRDRRRPGTAPHIDGLVRVELVPHVRNES